jgi:endonuclease/exonuclease/phosphatase family metal-dependent hydrolase
MRILTWNVACLPNKINFFRNPNKKFNEMIDKLCFLEPHIICLQEVFDLKIQKKFMEELHNLGFHTHVSQDTQNLISKNGLLTASISPIKNKTDRDYSMYTGAEYLIKKGILSTYINYHDRNIIVHNTHLQSNSIVTMYDTCREIRQIQKKELINHLRKNKHQTNIICGDLNDDIHTVEHRDFLLQIPFSNFITNSQKIETFPKHHKQLDYIIVSGEVQGQYFKDSVYTEKISDHEILLLDCNI